MEKWEIALDKFVQKWKKKKYVVWIIVCWSYITWNPSKHSDLDIHILLDKNITWRERWNEYINGILIEYFANPLLQNLKYYEDDYKQRRKVNIHMFTTWKILYDKNWDIKKLIKKAKEWNKKKYKKIDKISLEISKYFLWDMQDNLEEVFEANWNEFYIVYYVHLEKLFENYATYLKYDKIPVHKIIRFLVSEKDIKKYNVDAFPDIHFLKMYVKAVDLKNKNQMMKEYQKLTKYILEKMGGFSINWWKIRTDVEK